MSEHVDGRASEAEEGREEEEGFGGTEAEHGAVLRHHHERILVFVELIQVLDGFAIKLSRKVTQLLGKLLSRDQGRVGFLFQLLVSFHILSHLFLNGENFFFDVLLRLNPLRNLPQGIFSQQLDLGVVRLRHLIYHRIHHFNVLLKTPHEKYLLLT